MGAIAGSRQLPRRTTKVSANACWPERHAWLTRSVNTIQAWKGLKRNSWTPSRYLDIFAPLATMKKESDLHPGGLSP